MLLHECCCDPPGIQSKCQGPFCHAILRQVQDLCDTFLPGNFVCEFTVVCYAPVPDLPWFTSGVDFNFLHACRVGEASHPGPQIRLVVSNPTAVSSKVDQIVELGGSIYMLSETSATLAIQNKVTKEMNKKKFRSFWSKEVPSLKSTLSTHVSYRGEAIGTAIFSKVPTRCFRNAIRPAVWETCRLSVAILQLSCCEVVLVSVYGWPDNRSSEIRKQNDTLLAAAYEIVSGVGLPYIIAGDFNTDVKQLPMYQYFLREGALEAFELHSQMTNQVLEPTCKGSSRNDSCIFHPCISALVKHMFIDKSNVFDAHSPLCVELDVPLQLPKMVKWIQPDDISGLGIEKSNLDEPYHKFARGLHRDIDAISNETDGMKVLQQWSGDCERAMDQALKTQFRARPLPGIPQALGVRHRGRCQMQVKVEDFNRRCVASDRFALYEPPVEVFSALAHAKVKQVRRLKSLPMSIRAYEVACPSLSQDQRNRRTQQMSSEWKKILSAKGYGRAWFRWILSFQEVSYVPSTLPDMDDLSLFAQISECDANAACNQEVHNRRLMYKFALQNDMSEGFGSLTCKCVKKTQQHMLLEVPVTCEIRATLVRGRKGPPTLQMEVPRPFRENCKATFGGVECNIAKVEMDKVTLRDVQGSIPADGILKQTSYATTPDKINEAFEEFWIPFWQRDREEEQFQDQPWESFLSTLHDIDCSHMVAPVDMSDLEQWKLAISKLADKKAPGRDGWRNEEIKLLPTEAIGHLRDIVFRLLPHGFHRDFMTAKTTLLGKIPQPRGMEHTRPITILATLYRLASKVLYQQVVVAWGRLFPREISGGLPRRSVRDISLLQSAMVEQAIMASTPVTGSTTDLVKAFNLLPRRPLAAVLLKLGLSPLVVNFWMINLSRLSRSLHLFGVQCRHVSSTCGFPEGGSLSILAMLAVSFLFYHRVRTNALQPFAYADKWSWISSSTRDQFRAWVQVRNLIAELRMQFSVPKSWLWGSEPKIRAECLNVNLLLEDLPDTLQVQTFAKDLGEVMQYSRKQVIAPIMPKINDAVARLSRLASMPLTTEQKCKVVQTSVWPAALYGVDFHYMGQAHFNKLRRASCEAIVGHRKQANQYLAHIVLSRTLMDPLLFVLISALRALRRLMSIYPQKAVEMVKLASSFEGTVTCGPATSLARYLYQVDLSIEQSGEVFWDTRRLLNVCQDSSKSIVNAMRHFWYEYALSCLVTRRGLHGGTYYNVLLTQKTFSQLSHREQKLILLNMVGGFQSNAVKSTWDTNTESSCELCGETIMSIIDS